MRQLGKAFSIIAQADAYNRMGMAEVAYAEAETFIQEGRTQEQFMRQSRRHAKAVSGLNRRQFRIAHNKLSTRIVEKLEHIILDRHGWWDE